MTQCDVLIIGAGPTGLVLALWLTKLGVKVRIVDKTAEPGTTSRALAVQARSGSSFSFWRPVSDEKEIFEEARGIVAQCFPGRDIMQIDALDIVQGGGGIHCITQQEPKV